MGKTEANRSGLGRRSTRAATLIAGAVFLLVSVAQSNDFDDFIEYLNLLVMQEGPVAGSITEDLPSREVESNLATAGYELSGGQINTPAPEHPAQFALEGPDLNSTKKVTGIELNRENLQDNGRVDAPTGAAPSPLFNAREFSQPLLRFEEFGSSPLGPEGSVIAGNPLPSPADAASSSDIGELDAFLRQYVTPDQALPYPFPTRLANDPDNGGHDENPWKAEIEAFLDRSLVTPPAEGRPVRAHLT